MDVNELLKMLQEKAKAGQLDEKGVIEGLLSAGISTSTITKTKTQMQQDGRLAKGKKGKVAADDPFRKGIQNWLLTSTDTDGKKYFDKILASLSEGNGEEKPRTSFAVKLSDTWQVQFAKIKPASERKKRTAKAKQTEPTPPSEPAGPEYAEPTV